MQKIIFLILYLSFLGPLQASTSGVSFIEGNALVKMSKAFQRVTKASPNSSDLDFGDAMKFMGYVTGLSEALFSNRKICKNSSDNITVDQLTSIVVKFLNENPEHWHLPGIALVTYPLTKAFPCKNK